jgi:hypothetical protein
MTAQTNRNDPPAEAVILNGPVSFLAQGVQKLVEIS